MLIMVISDIHSNLEALEAVFADAREAGTPDAVWCLGDIVGYGANPKECLAIVREKASVCLAGNHDLAAIGKIGLEIFNPFAAEAARWTQTRLSADEVKYIASLASKQRVTDTFTLAHGSPRDPVLEYVLSEQAALDSFRYFDTQGCMVGHSHMPFICELVGDNRVVFRKLMPSSPPRRVALGNGRVIVNPGSVGQPRDGDPRASYLLYDGVQNQIELRRVGYNIELAQAKIKEAGLPDRLAARLSYGL